VTPGKTLRYRVTLTSRDSAACEAASFTLQPQPPSGFVASALPALTAGPGGSASASLELSVPLAAVAGVHQISVRATHGADATLVAETSASFEVVEGLSVTLQPVQREVEPGERVNIGLRLARDGVALDGSARVQLVAPGGSTHLRDVAVVGGSAQLSLASAARVRAGSYLLRATVSQGGEQRSASVALVVQPPATERSVASTFADGGRGLLGGCSIGADDAPGASAPFASPLLLLLVLVLSRRSGRWRAAARRRRP
jgi:hypothetical protein